MIRLEPLAEDGGSPKTGVQDSAWLRDFFLSNVLAGYAPFPCQLRDIRSATDLLRLVEPPSPLGSTSLLLSVNVSTSLR